MKVNRNNVTAHIHKTKYSYSSPESIKVANSRPLTHSIRSDQCSIMEKVFEELFSKKAKTNGNEDLDFWKLSDDGESIERTVNVDDNNIVEDKN